MDRFLGNSVISGDIPLPVLTLNETALTSNIAAMSAYCAERGVYLAPHAKTHMIADIVSKQIELGAWGATVATVEQAVTVAEWDVDRIVIANEVTGKANLLLLRELLRSHNQLQVYVLADSVAGVALLAAIMADLHKPLSVLLEVGFGGRRAGVRDRDRAFEVARAISETSRLKLAGLEMYEGAVAADRSPGSLSNVDAALAGMLRLARDMRRLGLFADEEAILSAGGSVFFDRVVNAWADKPEGFMILLRSGAYASHDDGHYKCLSPLDLSPALVVWANVLSVPEPEVSIIGMGKRDVPYDLGMPVPKWVVRNRKAETAPASWRITDTNDHHAFMNTANEPPQVGDIVGFGLSHPCTSFDKWSTVLVVDDACVVRAEWHTQF